MPTAKDILSREILDEFAEVHRFDIVDFYRRVSEFLQSGHAYIVDYYTGTTNNYISKHFKDLDDLILRSWDIVSIFEQSKELLKNYKWWELIASIEDIQATLLTIKNSPKWLRVSVNNNNYNRDTEISMILSQNQTLEDFNKDRLQSTDQHNEWVDTAVRNDLAEEDYTSEGGNLLKVSFRQRGRIEIRTIVDVIYDERVYGLDLPKKLAFDSDDLDVLPYKDTFIQTIDILSKLKRNDNPFYPEQGINKNLVVGSNINLVAYPVIFRQMADTFSFDDSIKSFAVKDIRREQDAIFIEFEVESRIGDNENIKISISN